MKRSATGVLVAAFILIAAQIPIFSLAMTRSHDSIRAVARAEGIPENYVTPVIRAMEAVCANVLATVIPLNLLSIGLLVYYFHRYSKELRTLQDKSDSPENEDAS